MKKILQKRDNHFALHAWPIVTLITIAMALCLHTANAQVTEPGNGLVFHFNFEKASGKNAITDETGRYQCLSKVGPFVVENGALRLADGAQIMIPCTGMPALSHDLTLSMWVAKGYFGDTAPLLFKGKHPQPLQFYFSIMGDLPQFTFKNEPNQQFWKGIFADGTNYGSSQRYSNKQWEIAGESPSVKAGQWTHLAVTFHEGIIKIYKDGQLVLNAKSATPQLLASNNEPLWIGAERLDGEESNYVTANALVNDIQLYSRALSGGEVAGIFDSEKSHYPTENLIPAGQVTLPPCNAYQQAAHPDYDPDFTRTLPQTALYQQHLPADTLNGKQTTSTLILKNGQMNIAINGRLESPLMIYPLLARDNKLRLTEVKGVDEDFAAAGIDLVNSGTIPPTFWTGEGKYDWPQLDSIFETAIKANPNAKIMANFYLRPPAWFFNKYPDEMERYLDANGNSHIWYTAAPLASEVWLQASLTMLRDVIGHIETSSYAGHVFGYFPTSGDAGEWYWPGSFTGGMPGYSSATQASFRHWLARQYQGSDAALQQAWNNPAVTLQTATVPDAASRLGAEYGSFRVREKAQQVYDYRHFMNDITFHDISETCRVIKEASNFHKVVCIYYGYPLLYAGKGSTMQKGGLQMLGQVFDSPFIDWIATPLDYVQRRGGEAGLNINAFNGSARLHHKMLWHENDLRTHFLPTPEFGRTANLPETLSVIDRGVGYALASGAGMWWSTLVGNAIFHQEKIMEEVSRLKTITDASLKTDRSPTAQVAFFFDMPSATETAVPKNDFMDRLCWGAYESAAHMGAPSDFYLLDDIKRADMPKYKLYVFLNAFKIDAATRKAIEAKVRANNAVSVWCYAPGFITDTGFSTEAMQELTGFHLEKEDGEQTITATVSAPQNPIMKYAGAFPPVTIAPSFWVADTGATSLATAGGKTVLAEKEFGTWRSVYSLLPLSQEVLMGLCDYAGVHIYNRSFDVLNANRGYVMLHTATAGEKTIHLPQKSDVTEMLTNHIMGKNITDFSEKLDAGVTRIYQVTVTPSP